MKLSLDFAFEGFRIVRHRPSVIPFWGIFLLISNGLAIALFFCLAQKPFMEFLPSLQALGQAGDKPDTTAFMQAYQTFYAKIMPAYFLLGLISIAIQAVVSCAIFRIVLDRPEKSFAGLRFGIDELRQIGARLIFTLLVMAIAIGAELAGALAGGIVALVLYFVSHVLAWGGLVVGLLVYIGGVAWAVTKLSLYSVQTFDEKKINLFGSWTLTKGNSFTLFLGYVVAAIMMFVVYTLCIVIFIAVVVAATGGHVPTIASGPEGMKQLMHLAVPVLIAFALLILIATPLMVAIVVGAPAAAYRALSRTTPKTTGAVF